MRVSFVVALTPGSRAVKAPNGSSGAAAPSEVDAGTGPTWDGKGFAGTTFRTETSRSFTTDTGACRDDWPSGNTSSGFVRIRR